MPAFRCEAEVKALRWIALLFLAVCVMVPIGFYLQAHGSFRGRNRLESWPKLRFQEGSTVKPIRPVAVCDSRALCAEARRMTRRLREAEHKGKEKDIQVATDWFKQLHPQIVWGEELEVLHADPRYTEVRILKGEGVGQQGFVYTVGLEEDAPPAPAGPSTPPASP